MTKELPNKCDFCGLRVTEWHMYIGSAKSSDDRFLALQELKKQEIIEYTPKRRVMPSFGIVHGEGFTDFCAVNSSAWSNKQTPCQYWQLKIEGATLSDHLTIYHTKKNQELATLFAILTIVITVVIAIIQLSI